MSAHRIVAGDEFFAALVAAGVVRKDDRIRRIVIDAQPDHALVVYVERYGDERILSVAQTLDGVEIKGVSA